MARTLLERSSDTPEPPKPQPQPQPQPQPKQQPVYVQHPRYVPPVKKKTPLQTVWEKICRLFSDFKYLPCWKRAVIAFFGIVAAAMIVSTSVMLLGFNYNWKWALGYSVFLALSIVTSFED